MAALNEQGLKDAINELAKIRQTLSGRLSDAEARHLAAEQEAMELRKLVGFVDFTSHEYANRLMALQAEIPAPPAL